MKSSFELEQSAKILSCYNNDISKGGKRATIGEIRIWGGKKYVKIADGWIKYDHGNQKIDNHRKTNSYTKDTDKEFSHDQVIKDHIENLSDVDKKEQIDKMSKKLEHLQSIQKKIDDHNFSSSGKNYNKVIDNKSLDKKGEIKTLINKIAEIKYGQASKEELDSLKDETQAQINNLKKENKLSNADKISELQQDLTHIQHASYRRFHSTAKDVVLGDHTKNHLDVDALTNDSTPWDEDLWDSDIDTEESDKIQSKLDLQKITDLNRDWFGQKTYLANNQMAFKQNIPDEAKIKVTFDSGVSAERTFKQYKEYIENTIKNNPEPKLQKEPPKPLKPLVSKDNPDYKAKWRKYFQEEEEIKKIKQENSLLTNEYIKRNVLPIKEIQILSLN